MSRVANSPVLIPKGVEVSISGAMINIKGTKGAMSRPIPNAVEIKSQDAEVTFAPKANKENADALAGTMRAHVNNMVTGVSAGFEKKLQLVGVGYRAQAQGKTLNLTLGFSHPVAFPVPDGISIETPSQTDVVIKGMDIQQVGQVAANIRALRPPEPYKGKGVRYADEVILRKEAKKK